MGRPSRMPSHDLSNPQSRERRDVLGSENGLRCRDVFHPVLGKSRPRCRRPQTVVCQRRCAESDPHGTLRHDFARHRRQAGPRCTEGWRRGARNHARDLVGARHHAAQERGMCLSAPARGVLAKTRTVFHLQGTEAAQAGDPLPAQRGLPAISAAGIYCLPAVPRPDPGKLQRPTRQD